MTHKPGLSGNIENLLMEIKMLIIHKEKKQQQIILNECLCI